MIGRQTSYPLRSTIETNLFVRDIAKHGSVSFPRGFGLFGRNQVRVDIAAYRLRSRYVHSLQELPGPLAVSAITGDTVRVEGATLLTFQGISRLARHVTLEFVDRQPKLEVEQYDYSGERHGVVKMPLSPEYWIGDAKNITLNVGTKRLEGFLSQLSSHFVMTAIRQLQTWRLRLRRSKSFLHQPTIRIDDPFLPLISCIMRYYWTIKRYLT